MMRAHSPKDTPTKKFYNGGYAYSSPRWDGPYQQQDNNNKAYGSPYNPTRRKKRPHKRNAPSLLNRLSPQSPTGKLLDRIGGSSSSAAEAVAGEELDEEVVAELYRDLPDSIPHFYTPGPEEVDRFLESVIGAPPDVPTTAFLVCCPPVKRMPFTYVNPAAKATRPTLALETHNLPVEQQPIKVEDLSDSLLHSSTDSEIAVNSLLSSHTLEKETPLLGDMTAPSPSLSVLEECRKHLVPVLLASAQSRDAGTHLDPEQCARLLSDDRCSYFVRQARETKRQLSSLPSGTPALDLMGNRVNETSSSSPIPRSRFGSRDTVISQSSRRDSEITLVDFPASRSPPKAPRAMLQSPRGFDRHDTLVSSPGIWDSSSLTPSVELIQEVDVQMTGTHPEDQLLSANPPASPSPADFVSHLPTRPGIWFKHQGRRHSEVVDIDVDLGEDLFFASREKLPFTVIRCTGPRKAP
ncbi:hypothetical protein BU15DRAFT_67715 [Melanogaster broomeanus]|nr:hypothetical protein BU15DRAFT_67715 [Melanogaster broomeanus]